MSAPSKVVPVEALFGLPTRSRAVLSPDGTRVAYLAPWHDRLNVFVRAVDSDWATPDDGTTADAPDRFAAAASYTGMSDLGDLVESVVPFARRAVVNSYLRYIGDPDDPRQAADMLARSPITRVQDITAPMLLIHGANDVRVDRRHSDRIVDALRARGAEVEYLLNQAEGHWFINPDSNIELYRTLERFLAKHLGARSSETRLVSA
ncbi:alpha/beta hydrolase family protein [Mycolicibacterium hippocampi]|uniref:Peptidase S9 prolyl oligopeptidase catalytic domain-containing protein n=1 Tax=Mycolicibacterium hippocampi TaxID=659824 RepID=A0A7I9ZHT8_9MYCO|nr:prolyl oligopeptidase family serine peptidase [Mycolicibacterium hippocampi]GFH00409.1 hypothetical protein MHIP_08920 [Mycolicibacterium hippocampi]